MSARTKKKVLPIKLDPQVYQDLKLVSQETDRSMASIIRQGFVKGVTQQAQMIRSSQTQKLTLLEHIKNNVHQGKVYHQGKTFDEIAYLANNGLDVNHD